MAEGLEQAERRTKPSMPANEKTEGDALAALRPIS